MAAISLYGALCLTAITWVLMTSLTVEFMAVASCSGARQMFSAGMTTTGQWAWWVTWAADRAHQQPLEPAGSAGADDEHVGVSGRLKERLGGQAGDGTDGD